MLIESTPHRIFNRHDQRARILNGEKYVEERCMVGSPRARNHGKMESKPVYEMITKGKNDVGLQTEAS